MALRFKTKIEMRFKFFHNTLPSTLLFGLLVIASTASGQFHVSTNLREDFEWDVETEQWVFVSSNKEELTFLEFNEDWSMLKHITPTISSAYIIKSMEHNEEYDSWECQVVSDVGNKYFMVLDLERNNVRFMSQKRNTEDNTLVKHTIKSTWVDED